MNNTKWEIGGWKIINPQIVVKLGFVLDSYKMPRLPELWTAAEVEAKTRMPNFVAADFFHQEDTKDTPTKDLTMSARWYTPASNRVKISDIKEGH